MLWVYVPRGSSLDRIQVTSDIDVADNAVWFDLVNPNSQEDKVVERKVGLQGAFQIGYRFVCLARSFEPCAHPNTLRPP